MSADASITKVLCLNNAGIKSFTSLVVMAMQHALWKPRTW